MTASDAGLEAELLAALAREIPERCAFLTPDELAESTRALADAHPGVVRVEVVGHSTDGRPLEVLRLGEGPRRALLIGVPHPNEPIGTVTLEVLTRLLAARSDLREALGFAFTVLKVADPDGLALNASWLKGEFSLTRYALGYYRSPAHEQVEWGFPVHYKTLHFTSPPPETRAVMRLIAEDRPDLLYSLHNASFCGAYFYASRRIPPLFARLQRLIVDAGVPLHRGEPEVPYIESWTDGIYPIFGAREAYDYLERQVSEDPARHITTGTSSSDHLAEVVPSAFALVSELPYFTDPILEDRTASTISRRDAGFEGLRRIEETLREIERHFVTLRPPGGLLAADRLTRAVADYVARTSRRLPAHRKALSDPGYLARATRAQAFDAMVCKSLHAVLVLGETYRIAEAAGEAGRAAEIRAQVEARIRRLTDESHIQTLPLERLVEVQAGALLLALLAAQRRR